ncbi:ATP-dependent zinc protease [Ferrimonas lipolytica]|uniref:Retropepsin-like aspartic endopeptidase domain-containing protein n=1 Tax=Ferrimonas lipolytica TaxID=2724191 RepID=A0A6H1UCX4_9GAMM|nr:RimK/LysX family protein [Ferrimonas lipolytica]QIZ76440.1 hypothetical protein HER31_05930 [Ferrimonas lipolytica]
MIRTSFLSITLLAVLSGCAATKAPVDSVTTTALNQALSNHGATLQQTLLEQSSMQQESQSAQQQLLLDKIAELQQQIAALPQPEHKPEPVIAPKCEPVVVTQQSDKMIFGDAERVLAPQFDRTFDARVDTGAAGTSMIAMNTVMFERNGEEWVRFDLPEDGEKQTTFEAKVEHFIQIKKAAYEENDRRPVIKVRLKIGTFNGETEVNLTDRSKMEFPLLLGRKFFKDIAIVDVSKQYVQENN